MQSITLGEILTQEQIQECVRIVKVHHKPLKPYLEQLRPQLEAKQVDPGYLAYMVEYLITTKKRY